MEPWLVYALLSALFAGAQMSIQKVAVERGLSSALINTWSTVTSSLIALAISIVFFDFSGTWQLGLLLGLASGLTHAIGSILRMDALKHIDTAIFFPLYKMAGPIFALIIGVLIFSERFNTLEIIGISLGITVPLLLLHRKEESRQKNLRRGVVIMLGSALFTAIAAGIGKYGVDVFSSIFLFIAISHAFGAISGWVTYEWQKRKAQHTSTLFAHKHADMGMLSLAMASGLAQFLGFATLLLAFTEGSLAIVYTVNSFYILIPIVLSVWWYKEHFNARKGAAIIVSILALAFLR